jgi:hypothetical protein
MPTLNHELAKVLLTSFAAFANVMAQMVDVVIREEEALTKAGLSAASLQDPTLVVKLIGESHPDLIGRYVVYSMKLAELQNRTRDLTKLTIDEKREAIKQFNALAKEVESIGLEIGK